MAEKILVTSALPYANGPAHLGHLVEYLQTDIWVRYLKLTGRDAVYVWASDTHGAPIEINAAKHGMRPEEFVARWGASQRQDFVDFLIGFDTFYTTHSPENERWVGEIFRRLREGGHVEERPLEQWYCEKDARFLPDRFVKGTCPSCGAADQYGDVCEICNKAYASTELQAPYCSLCGTPPVRRSSNHFFFKLDHFREFLTEYVSREGVLHPSVRNSVKSWIDGGLQDWCVSRDGPYFGFEIPGEPGKYFYVWLDAPIGYIAATEHLVGPERTLSDYWGAGAQSRIVHFIGKDIVYFHALFWPAVLHACGLHVPDKIQVHGMLTLGGEKLSKSRGRMVTAREYLDAGLDPEALRWFYASNLGAGPYDVPLAREEIRNRVNAELVKTLANFVSRALTPLKKDFEGKIGIPSDDQISRELWAKVLEASGRIRDAYERVELREATQALVELGFEANKYLQDRAPWSKRKQGDAEGAHRDLSLCANVAWAIGTWLSPILPRSAERLVQMLGGVPFDPKLLAAGADYPLPPGTVLGEIAHLAKPLDEAALAKLWPEPGEEAAATPRSAGGGGGSAPAKEQGAAAAAAQASEPEKAGQPEGIIAFDDFLKVDLRVGRILTAERVPKADKLLVLTVDVGEEQPRTIAAGIAEHYEPEELPGKHVIVVANLAPRKIRGIESRGMLLAGGGDRGKVVLAEVPGVAPGSRVK